MSSVVQKATNHTLSCFRNDKSWKEPFYFLQAADTQLGFMDVYGDHGISTSKYPNVSWQQEIDLCRQSVKIINTLKPRPKFFIICGDMLDAYPADWPEIRQAQEKDFLSVYSEIHPDIPLICVCGNHDVGNTPTFDTIDIYRSSFGDDYFSFWVDGVFFIVINSQYYADNSQVVELSQEQDEWLDATLSKDNIAGAKHVIIFQHIPWFIKDANEEKMYFNMELELRTRMLKKFEAAGVSKIFCGHYHRNAGGWFNHRLELIITTAIGCQLGDDSHGMRVVKINEHQISHEFYSLDDFPQNINNVQ